jgi:proline iminopeptidase
MKRVVKGLVTTLLCLGTVFMALLWMTRGDYPVARLVTDDPSLPSQHIAGNLLHMRSVEGPLDATTVIVLHGGPGGDFRSLQGLEALSDEYRIIFYDQRGAGLSQRVGAGDLTLDGYLEELRGVIDHASPDAPPIVIGHSWGAMLATAYLGQNPDGVRAAILIEPGYLGPKGHRAWQAESRKYLSGAAYWREAVLTGFRAQHVSGPDMAAAHDFLIGHMVGVFTNHPDNPYHCGDGYTAPSWRFGGHASEAWNTPAEADLDLISAGAATYAGPVLLMAGDCNDWIGETQQSEHAARFSNATLTVIPNAGHDVIWDNPEAALSALRRFLRLHG